MEKALGLKQLNIFTKRKNIMGKDKAKKVNKEETVQKDRKYMTTIITTIITTSITLFLTRFVLLNEASARYEERFNSIDANLENITDRIDAVSSDVKDNANDLNDLASEVGFIKGYLGLNVTAIEPSDSFINAVSLTYNSTVPLTSSSDESLWEDTSVVIGTDKLKAKPCTAAELENETVIISYTDTDGSLVLFRGQFNENGRWDRDCTINRYTDGKLSMIMDASYDDGKLMAYRQVMSTNIDTNNENRDIWLVSDREVTDNGNTGETWTYFRQNDILQECDTENLKYTDVMTQDDFLENNNDLIPEGYYNGITSNDKYNDNTGNAYLVKYNQDGYVRFLYEGRFVDGVPYDTTGDAWSIAFGFDGVHYYYYKGSIKGSERTRDLTTDDIVTVKQIEELLKDKTFDCVLQWYSFEI